MDEIGNYEAISLINAMMGLGQLKINLSLLLIN